MPHRPASAEGYRASTRHVPRDTSGLGARSPRLSETKAASLNSPNTHAAARFPAPTPLTAGRPTLLSRSASSPRCEPFSQPQSKRTSRMAWGYTDDHSTPSHGGLLSSSSPTTPPRSPLSARASTGGARASNTTPGFRPLTPPPRAVAPAEPLGAGAKTSTSTATATATSTMAGGRPAISQEAAPALGANPSHLRPSLGGGGRSPQRNSHAAAPTPARARRNSQAKFADSSQTVIVLDWDDTLLPSGAIIDLRLNLATPLHLQNLPLRTRSEIRNDLAMCSERVEKLLRLAHSFGKVVIVTLARPPWVTDACNFFYPAVGELLKTHNVKIVYAQQGSQIEPRRVAAMTESEAQAHWSRLKADAISREVEEFYSQYEGQTWKNVISIGDSNFERLGARHATEEYMKKKTAMGKISTMRNASGARRGTSSLLAGADSARLREAEIQGHLYRVRTKTFKMLEHPAFCELAAQLEWLHHMLPSMVRLDDGFDLEYAMSDQKAMDSVERILRGEK